jgi:hypothetical protein
MSEPITRPQGLSVDITGALKVIKYLWKIPAVRWALQSVLSYATKKIIAYVRKKRNAKKLKDGQPEIA